jgi:hypothetical protein
VISPCLSGGRGAAGGNQGLTKRVYGYIVKYINYIEWINIVKEPENAGDIRGVCGDRRV